MVLKIIKRINEIETIIIQNIDKVQLDLSINGKSKMQYTKKGLLIDRTIKLDMDNIVYVAVDGTKIIDRVKNQK